MASVNTQFSIAVHVLAAIAHYEGVFTSEILAGSVNANPVFVKRILVKLSKAKLAKTTVGKSGGYDLATKPKEYFPLRHLLCGKPSKCFCHPCLSQKQGVCREL